jgi:hypothetical protein
MEEYRQWLEQQIERCLNDKDLQREHWAFCKAYEKFTALRQPPVSGALQSVDPLDDENSEIHKIGREIAEMSDEEFEANCKAIEKMLKGSKGNDR